MGYNYLVQKVSQNDVDKATARLNELGGNGWKVIYVTPFSQDLVVVLERQYPQDPAVYPKDSVDDPEKKKVGRPKKIAK